MKSNREGDRRILFKCLYFHVPKFTFTFRSKKLDFHFPMQKERAEHLNCRADISLVAGLKFYDTVQCSHFLIPLVWNSQLPPYKAVVNGD